MARCRCQSENCTCSVRAGAGVVISGSGSPADPWTISSAPSAEGTLRVEDTFTVDLVLSGKGTLAEPYLLRANASQVPGGLTTGHGIIGLGNGPDPLRIDLCTYDDIAATMACVTPPLPSTGATAGIPGAWTPDGSIPPDDYIIANSNGVVASPTTAWTTGQYMQGATGGSIGWMHWNGSTWVTGKKP